MNIEEKEKRLRNIIKECDLILHSGHVDPRIVIETRRILNEARFKVMEIEYNELKKMEYNELKQMDDEE